MVRFLILLYFLNSYLQTLTVATAILSSSTLSCHQRNLYSKVMTGLCRVEILDSLEISDQPVDIVAVECGGVVWCAAAER